MSKRINFIDPVIERPALRRDVDTWINISFVAIVALIFVSMLHINGSYSRHKKSNAQLNVEKMRLEKAVIEMQAKSQEYLEHARDLEPLHDVLRNKILWSDAMKELSALVGRDVWLEKLQSVYKDKNRSVIVTGYASSQQKVNNFFADLEGSYFFRNVMIKYSQRKADYAPSLYEFQFTATIPQFDAKMATR